jgi:hypothetical protein
MYVLDHCVGGEDERMAGGWSGEDGGVVAGPDEDIGLRKMMRKTLAQATNQAEFSKVANAHLTCRTG